MKRVVVFIVAVVGTQLIFLSCGSDDGRQEAENFQFYYYPGKNVYYDVERKSFFYSLDGGNTWDSLRNVLEEEPATLGEKIILYSDNIDVYKDNAAHRKLYNGRLYNIGKLDTSLASAPEVSERKVQKRTEAKPKEEEEEVVRGLKKFLNKIFGKKNKKKEDH